MLNYDFQVETLNTNLNILKKWNSVEEFILDPMQLPNINLYSIAKNNKNDALEILKGYIESSQNILTDLNAYKKELDRIQNQPVSRTGKIQFRIGILNSGDRDGVLFPDGELKFADTVIFISKALDDNKRPKYTILKPHSFKEVIFSVNEKISTVDALKKWKSIVKSGIQEKFTITFTASRKKIIASSRLEP